MSYPLPHVLGPSQPLSPDSSLSSQSSRLTPSKRPRTLISLSDSEAEREGNDDDDDPDSQSLKIIRALRESYNVAASRSRGLWPPSCTAKYQASQAGIKQHSSPIAQAQAINSAQPSNESIYRQESLHQAIQDCNVQSSPIAREERPSLPHSDIMGPQPIAAPLSSESRTDPSDEMEDEGEELKRLMQRAEQMRSNALSPMNPVTVPDPVATPHSLHDAVREVRVGEHVQVSHMDPQVKTEETSNVVRDERKHRAIAFLESIPLALLSQLHTSLKTLNHQEVSPAKLRSRVNRVTADHNSDGEDSNLVGAVAVGGRDGVVGLQLTLKNRKTGENQVTAFPDDPLGSAKREPALHRITCILKVAELLYEAVLGGFVTTKRDIYYKNVQLFRTQPVVDKIVDDLVAMAGLKRQDFNVCATSKGLVASSSLQIHLKTGEVLSPSATNAALIPPVERIATATAPDGLDWVLIVEKDAVFQTLCSMRILDDSRLGPGAIITGKGYPDLATLQLLDLISRTFPNATFHALVDADPHGLDILQVYQYGSKATRFSHDYAGLALGEKLKWMGVRASELKGLGISWDDMIPLTNRDVGKAMAMLRIPGLPEDQKVELQHMLHINRKAEIQILSSVSDQESHLPSGLFGEMELDKGATKDLRRGGLVEYIMGKLAK